jgi:predicted amidohydrolase YtcJ
MSGAVYGPDEQVTMAEALRAYTRDAAYITREESLKGSIEPGKVADLAVLSDDLLTIPADRILATKVDLTILGGRIVFDRRSTH